MSREIPPTARDYDAREVVSALQKACRRSDVDAAMYWAAELARSGYVPWLWKRLRTIAIEDMSPEATGQVADVFALSDAAKQDKGDGMLLVARAVIALCLAPKSRVATWATAWHCSDAVPRRDVPSEALDMHTLRGRRMGRGAQHFADEASVLVEFEGDLEALSKEYEDGWLRTERGDAEPVNPWRQAPADPQMTLQEGDA